MNERIKAFRKAEKLTQAQLAQSLRKTNNYIYMLESGNVAVTDNIIYDICRIYNVSEDWLRTGKGTMYNPENKEREMSILSKRVLKADEDDYIAKLIKNLAVLDIEDWKELNRIIKKLLKDQEKDSSEN